MGCLNMVKIYSYIVLFSLLFSVDYESEIQPIFNNHCGNCHLGNSAGGLNLSNYDNVISSGSIVAGDHTASELYQRLILPESSNQDMPPAGSLTQAQIDLIADWIDEGALSEEASCSVDLGDVNGDGLLNVLDVVSLAQLVLGNGSIDFDCAADYNDDDLINVLDIVSIVNAILG